MTVQDLAKYLKKYSKKAGVKVYSDNTLILDTKWSSNFNEAVDTDGRYIVFDSGKQCCKIKCKDFNYVLYCYQENGIPKICTLYIKDTMDKTLNHVQKALRKLF